MDPNSFLNMDIYTSAFQRDPTAEKLTDIIVAYYNLRLSGKVGSLSEQIKNDLDSRIAGTGDLFFKGYKLLSEIQNYTANNNKTNLIRWMQENSDVDRNLINVIFNRAFAKIKITEDDDEVFKIFGIDFLASDVKKLKIEMEQNIADLNKLSPFKKDNSTYFEKIGFGKKEVQNFINTLIKLINTSQPSTVYNLLYEAVRKQISLREVKGEEETTTVTSIIHSFLHEISKYPDLLIKIYPKQFALLHAYAMHKDRVVDDAIAEKLLNAFITDPNSPMYSKVTDFLGVEIYTPEKDGKSLFAKKKDAPIFLEILKDNIKFILRELNLDPNIFKKDRKAIAKLIIMKFIEMQLKDLSKDERDKIEGDVTSILWENHNAKEMCEILYLDLDAIINIKNKPEASRMALHLWKRVLSGINSTGVKMSDKELYRLTAETLRSYLTSKGFDPRSAIVKEIGKLKKEYITDLENDEETQV